jgi:phage FluMu gp28-like protein
MKINYTRPFMYPYQTPILNAPARFTCTEASTKVGKTASHIVWLFEEALKCKENQSVWWIAPTFAQAKIAYDRMKVQISSKDFFKANDTNLVITLITGVKIQFKTGEKPDNLYGDDVYAACVDEASRCREEAWFALRSTLTSTGGKCKFIGNVRGKKNWYYRLCQKAKNGEDPNYHYFKITAYDAAEAGMLTKDGRPFLDEINDAKKDLPDNVFRELYLAEASDDASNPFGLTHISRAVYPISTQPAVCFGIDLAKKNDWTVITGLDRHGNVCYFDRFQKDWKQTKEAIVSLPNVPTCIDATGTGDAILEDVARLRDNVEGYIFTSRSKQQLMEGLAFAIQNRQVTVLEGVMKDELDSFEYEYTRTGVRYTCPSGLHDDAVCSLSLARQIHGKSITSGSFGFI